jgi:hypothetical protein
MHSASRRDRKWCLPNGAAAANVSTNHWSVIPCAMISFTVSGSAEEAVKAEAKRINLILKSSLARFFSLLFVEKSLEKLRV